MRKRLPAIGLALLLAVLSPPSGAAALERVAGELHARNGFSWHYAYDIGVQSDCVRVHVGIRLVPAAGVRRVDLERVVPLWQAGIERVWSGRFALAVPDGRRLPIVVDVRFNDPHFHHAVIVRPGTGGTNQLNWKLLDSPALVAHEFGHMLGVFDEYPHGGTAPDGDWLDPQGIMGLTPTSGSVARARHFEGLLQWFVAGTGAHGTRLVAMAADRDAQGGTTLAGKPKEGER